MIDETNRRNFERFQNINRHENIFFFRSKNIVHNFLERNDDTFMTFSEISITIDDKFSNLISFLQSRFAINNSEFQNQIARNDNDIVFRSFENYINDFDVENDFKNRIQNSNNEQFIRKNRSRLTIFIVANIQQFISFQFKTIKKFKHRDANRRFILNCQNEKKKIVKITFILRIIN